MVKYLQMLKRVFVNTKRFGTKSDNDIFTLRKKIYYIPDIQLNKNCFQQSGRHSFSSQMSFSGVAGNSYIIIKNASYCRMYYFFICNDREKIGAPIRCFLTAGSTNKYHYSKWHVTFTKKSEGER